MSQWSSLFAEKGLQVPKLVGDLMGPCLFAVLMGVGAGILWGVGASNPPWPRDGGQRRAVRRCYAVTVFVPIPVLSWPAARCAGFRLA